MLCLCSQCLFSWLCSCLQPGPTPTPGVVGRPIPQGTSCRLYRESFPEQEQFSPRACGVPTLSPELGGDGGPDSAEILSP